RLQNLQASQIRLDLLISLHQLLQSRLNMFVSATIRHRAGHRHRCRYHSVGLSEAARYNHTMARKPLIDQHVLQAALAGPEQKRSDIESIIEVPASAFWLGYEARTISKIEVICEYAIAGL